MKSPSLDEPSGGGWTRARVVFLLISALAVVAIGWLASEVLLPFILALVIAYVLMPAVALVERLRVPRSAAVIIVYVVTVAVAYLAVAAVAPRIYAETARFAKDAPGMARELSGKWGPRVDEWVQGLLQRKRAEVGAAEEHAAAFEIVRQPDGSFGVELGSGVEVVQDGPKRWRVVAHRPSEDERFSVAALVAEFTDSTVLYVKRNALDLIKLGQVVISRTARAVFLLVMTLMLAAYLMLTREQVLGFFRSLAPARSRASFDRLLTRIDRGLAGVVRGQLLICLVNGVLSAVGFWLFGLKYWPVLAIIAGVMSIVPIFGSILSSVPVVLIGLTQDVWTALWVLLWILGIHQIEANLLNPKIIGSAAKIHPVLVVFALMLGEHRFGLWGALLAVPALSLLQSLFQHFRFQSLPDSGPDSLAPPAPDGGR